MKLSRRGLFGFLTGAAAVILFIKAIPKPVKPRITGEETVNSGWKTIHKDGITRVYDEAGRLRVRMGIRE